MKKNTHSDSYWKAKCQAKDNVIIAQTALIERLGRYLEMLLAEQDSEERAHRPFLIGVHHAILEFLEWKKQNGVGK